MQRAGTGRSCFRRRACRRSSRLAHAQWRGGGLQHDNDHNRARPTSDIIDGMSNGARRGGIEQRIGREHRRLDAMFAELQDAIVEGEGAVADIFSQLREALEDHLAQEDRVYYPALRALRPEHRRSLEHFTLAHDVFRAEFAVIAGALEESPTEELKARIDAIAESFAAHESGEEALLRQIDAAIDGKGSALR